MWEVETDIFSCTLLGNSGSFRTGRILEEFIFCLATFWTLPKKHMCKRQKGMAAPFLPCTSRYRSPWFLLHQGARKHFFLCKLINWNCVLPRMLNFIAILCVLVGTHRPPKVGDSLPNQSCPRAVIGAYSCWVNQPFPKAYYSKLNSFCSTHARNSRNRRHYVLAPFTHKYVVECRAILSAGEAKIHCLWKKTASNFLPLWPNLRQNLNPL